MLYKRAPLQEFALEASKEVTKLLNAYDNPDLPVIVHVFSGSGCIMLEQLESLIMLGRQVVEMDMASDEAKSLVKLGEAIARGGQVFDSSPAYLDIFCGMNAIGAAVQNAIVRIIVQIVFVVYSLFVHLKNVVTQQLDRADEHWCWLRDSDIATRQAYVYSTKDELTNALKVEEMIEMRKKRQNTTILVKKFIDSPHCAHLKTHPKVYKAFIEEFLTPLSKEIEKQEKIEEVDPEFTDYELSVD
jgi:hypothetical protein